MTAATTARELHLSPDINEFLNYRNATAAFDQFRQLVIESFPDQLEMKYWLLNDPDVESRAWCMIEVVLPGSGTDEGALDRWKKIHQRVVAEIPFEYAQWFGIWRTYLQEQP